MIVRSNGGRRRARTLYTRYSNSEDSLMFAVQANEHNQVTVNLFSCRSPTVVTFTSLYTMFDHGSAERKIVFSMSSGWPMIYMIRLHASSGWARLQTLGSCDQACPDVGRGATWVVGYSYQEVWTTRSATHHNTSRNTMEPQESGQIKLQYLSIPA